MSQKTTKPALLYDDQGTYADYLFMCLPLAAMACCFYGLRVAVLCGVAFLTANLCDRLVAKMRRVEYVKNEWSSEAFALMLALLMPATVSYYVLIVGVLTAVLLGKEAFGGYGAYPFHPVAVGYVVTAVSWPGQMFSYPRPDLFRGLPLGSTAGVILEESPAHILKSGGLPNINLMDMLLGNYAGPMGSTMLLVIFACALFLLHRRRIGVMAPLVFMGTCFVVAFCFPRLAELAFTAPWHHAAERLSAARYELSSGATFYAAVFLINDPVTMPKNKISRAVYAAGLGLMATMFRYFGAFEAGACFALLIMNSLSGWLDRAVQSAVYRKGVVRREA